MSQSLNIDYNNLGDNYVYAGDTRKQLKALIKKAYPLENNSGVEVLVKNYWMRICVNHNEHKKKVIDKRKWENVQIEISEIAKRSRSTLGGYWSNLKCKKVSIKQKKLPPSSPPKS